MPDKLPEEFAPTGPKLSRFPVQPAPPVRPRLFPDEAKFVFRLALLSGATTFIAWGGVPFWIGIIAAGLPAVGDLCASCAADAITVERRATAWAWLDIAQGIGAVCGLIGFPVAVALVADTLWRLWALLGVMILAWISALACLPALRDRGTPRSAWPISTYLNTLRTPFGPEPEQFRSNLRRYVERELAPHALEWDEAGIFPREVFKGMAEIGALGINYPEEVGGAGGDYWYVVVLAEELVHSRNAGVNMALLVQSQMATPIINEIGTPEQKKEFLAPALAGEKIAALGISEPDAASDVASLRTSALRSGDDYVVNGAKMWSSNGTRAAFITLAVRTGGPGHGGISLVTFPTDVKGFSVSKKLAKVGKLSSDTALILFEDCRIPARHLLGEEYEGLHHVQTNCQGE